MNEYKVCINYGRKCAAFEVIVNAASELAAIKQAKQIAVNCGFDEVIKKVTVKGAQSCS